MKTNHSKFNALVENYVKVKKLFEQYKREVDELRETILSYLKSKGLQEEGKLVVKTAKYLVSASEVSKTERDYNTAMNYIEKANIYKDVMDIDWKKWDLLVSKGRIPKEVDIQVSKRVVSHYRLNIE